MPLPPPPLKKRSNKRKWTILGQDPDVLIAMWANILSWIVCTFFSSQLYRLLPSCPEAEDDDDNDDDENQTKNKKNRTQCISIGRPGGLEQLRIITLREGIVTIGYNVSSLCAPPFTPPMYPLLSSSSSSSSSKEIPGDCVILHNESFSINYADCAIRWGLYESAKQFVGWPIVPGFDVAGTIEYVGTEHSTRDDTNTPEGEQQQQQKQKQKTDFQKGDRVFGVTLFGAYSSHVLVPKIQLRKIPDGITFAQAAALPAVSLTALHALSLAGFFPQGNSAQYNNRSILIHSAAGGVGSMLVQMSKLLGLSPIVGVVGSTSKIQEAQSLGCDVVIDKSTQNLWDEAEKANNNNNGFAAIMDANGVSTLQQSYDHLAPTGRLVIFGFHSNLPLGKAALSPKEWITMARKMTSMPKFNPMDLVVSNKSVLGFNLSFFADEKEIVTAFFDQICLWIQEKKIRCPKVVEMTSLHEIGAAHDLIMSGKSVGKIVINTRS